MRPQKGYFFLLIEVTTTVFSKVKEEWLMKILPVDENSIDL